MAPHSKRDIRAISTMGCSTKMSSGRSHSVKTMLATAFMIGSLATTAMLSLPRFADAQEELQLSVDGAVTSSGPSFDCARTTKPIEHMICEVDLELGNGSSNYSELKGTAWSGVRIAGDVIPSDIDITLNFDIDGRLNGSAGCNRYVGSYEQRGNGLILSSIGATRKLCPELPMLAERRFLAALERANGWRIKDGQLYLFGTGAELTFAKAN